MSELLACYWDAANQTWFACVGTRGVHRWQWGTRHTLPWEPPPSGQGGIQILAALVPRLQEQIVAVVVVDATVIMQPKFEQSFLFMFLEVPQIQFKIEVPDIPVVCRDGYGQC